MGNIELASIGKTPRSAVLSRVVVGDPARRGRGIGRRMVEHALEVAFGELGLERVELRVFTFNEPAIRCYERVGFEREGLLLALRCFASERWDALTMVMLETAWRARAGRSDRGSGV